MKVISQAQIDLWEKPLCSQARYDVDEQQVDFFDVCTRCNRTKSAHHKDRELKRRTKKRDLVRAIMEIRKYNDQLLAALHAADSVMWMAEEYADAGGTYGPEMRDYKAAKAKVDKAFGVGKPSL